MAKIDEVVRIYLDRVFEKARSGVREESYYLVLEELLRQVGILKNKKLQIDSFPKKTEAGNPDIRILNGQGRLVGYIEAKPLEKEALETVEDLEQLERYRKTFPNLILTNFLEFRLYRNGELLGKSIKISDLHPFLGRKFENIPAQNTDQLDRLLEQFFSFTTPRIYTAKALAIELARKTRFLRDEIIEQELIREREEEKKPLFGFYQAFKEYLIASLTEKDFADLYAQTIAYGLFIARHRYEMKPTLFEQEREAIQFTRDQAYKFIQPSLGILREVFKFISSEEPSKQLRVMVDDIADLLAAADLEKVVKSFHKDKGKRDPIIHFYETFLAEYDPEEREKRGVYYTPEPVVSYIVKSIHCLLKEKLGKEDGLATSSVTVLDPAAGTLTFPAKAIMLATDEYKKKYGTGGLKKFIKEHILENFYAFELMMAPYAIGHLKIDFVLELLGYRLEENERFKLYLTNTLEFQDLAQTEIPTVAPLAKESKLAGKVKREVPILVILGNPPYSAGQSKQSEFVKTVMKDYLTGLGVEKEKKKGVMQDDYIRFIRFAHWKIEQAERGIIGLITNNSYLDGLIHRAMRKKILDDFNKIYLLNLHGNSRLGEKTPQGGKDENVFDIQQGVGIILLVKDNSGGKEVHYADIYGLREEKYKFLETYDVKDTDWKGLVLTEPYYWFVPKESKGEENYRKFISVKDIFKKSISGTESKRDNLIVDFDPHNLANRVRLFTVVEGDEEYIRDSFQLSEKSDLNIKKARALLKGVDINNFIVEYNYRPFDKRWLFFHKSLVSRTRQPLMDSMNRKNNLALCLDRQFKGNIDQVNAITLVTDVVADKHFSAAQTIVFPLYVFTESGQEDFFDRKQRTVNFSKKLWESVPGGMDPEPVFSYIYAILYSNVYRKKYKEFLKSDFPMIPFTKDARLFQGMAVLGEQLIDQHLLKTLELNNPIAKFYGKDSGMVEKRDYKQKNKRIYINDSQYFEGIEPEVWNYYIGGYQVLDKWLKDRKGRTLSSEDIKHYCKVVTTISKTIEIQKEIDKLYPEVEKNLI